MNELLNRLNKLEEAYDLLTYKDRWNAEDYARSNELTNEIIKTKKAIRELKGE